MSKQEHEPDRWSEVPALLSSLYEIVDRLETLFPGRKFTPDGHLVGSIGEAIAARMFGLLLLPASTPEHDATTADRQTLVQIKLTQGKRNVSLRHEPKHLLVLRLHSDLGVEVVYNGRGRAPWLSAGRQQKNGQRAISLAKLRDLDIATPDEHRLPTRSDVDLRQR